MLKLARAERNASFSRACNKVLDRKCSGAEKSVKNFLYLSVFSVSTSTLVRLPRRRGPLQMVSPNAYNFKILVIRPKRSSAEFHLGVADKL